MINSLLYETCSIKHRQTDSRDSFGQYDYYLEENVPCLGLNIVGSKKEDVQSITVTDSITLFLTKEVSVGDKIIYDGYEYDIVEGGVIIGRDIVTGNVEYYAVSLQKRKAYPSEKVEIKRRNM